MIKLKSLLTEVIACGECLSYTYKQTMKNHKKKNFKAVYGTVQNKLVSNN